MSLTGFSMTPEEYRALPSTTWEGSFRIFGVDVQCAVLDNGKRVIKAESVAELLEAMQKPCAEPNRDELEAFARWQRGG